MSQNSEVNSIVHSTEYSLGFEDGYEACEAELSPIISELGTEIDGLQKDIEDLKRHIYVLGGTVQ